MWTAVAVLLDCTGHWTSSAWRCAIDSNWWQTLGVTVSVDSTSVAWQMFVAAFAKLHFVFSFAVAFGPVAVDYIARWMRSPDDCDSFDWVHLAMVMMMMHKRTTWGHGIAGVDRRTMKNGEDQTQIAIWTSGCTTSIKSFSTKINSMKLTIEPNECWCDGMSDTYVSRDSLGDGGRMTRRWLDDTRSMYRWCEFELSMICVRCDINSLSSHCVKSIDWKWNG